MFKRLFIAISALTIAGSVIATAGLWNNFPKVGSARYCITYVNGVCQQYVPAGPSTLTGNETIPVDTNLSGGQTPQTVIVPIDLLNGNALALYTGSSFTKEIPDNIYNVVLTYSGTITSAVITAPANPINGQRLRVNSNQTITAFSFAANTGQTLGQTSPSVLTVSTTGSQGYEFIYSSSDNKWYRLQ